MTGVQTCALPIYVFPELEEACRRKPGLVLAGVNDGHWITFHTKCSVIGDVFLLTDQHMRKRAETEALLRLAPELAFPVPPTHAARYRPSVGKDLILGLRPEHITEPRGEGREPRCEFAMTLDVLEPMGMETMVFFTVNGTEVCARVEPSAATAPGQQMRLYANLNHMHLIDPATELVL